MTLTRKEKAMLKKFFDASMTASFATHASCATRIPTAPLSARCVARASSDTTAWMTWMPVWS